MLMKERKLKHLERHHVFMNWKTNIIKMSVLPKLMCLGLMQVIKISANFFVDINELTLKISEKEDSSGKNHFLILRLTI